MKLIDTTIAIDHLRGLPEARDLLATLLKSEEVLAASEVSRFELLAGVRENEVAALETFFETLTWIPVTEVITRAAGQLAQSHRRAYSGIDDADYLIAATAVALDAELLTTNLRHFPMLPGLKSPY